MGADLILQRECETKRAFGRGDVLAGTTTLLRMLKAHGRGQALLRAVLAAGDDPDEVEVAVQVQRPEGTTTENRRVADLVAEAEPLERAAGGCAGCPARLEIRPYGCFEYVNYPLSAADESWLVERVQPEGSLGATVCAKAIKDFGYDGAPIEAMRARKLLEAPAAFSRVLKKGWWSSEVVRSSQILQALWFVGPIQPSHGLLVLTWLGLVELDGKLVTEPAALSALLNLDASARASRTRLALGEERPATAAVQRMVRAVYLAWVQGVMLLVDA